MAKFMTKFDVENPGNFQNVLAKMREDKLFKAKEARVSAMTEKIMDGISNLSPEQKTDQNTVLQIARDSFDPKSTPAEKEMAVKMAFTFQKRAQDQNIYDREQKGLDRAEDLYQTRKADTSLLAQSQRLSPHGVEGYSVPPDKPEDYLSRLSDEGFLNYQRGQRTAEKEDLDKRFKESQILRNQQPSGNNFKRTKEESLNSLNAKISSFGGTYDPTVGTFTVPTDKTGVIDPNITNSLNNSGFEIYPVKGGDIKEDAPGLFTGNKYYKTFQLGGFSPTAEPIESGSVVGTKPTDTKRRPLTDFFIKKGKPLPVDGVEKTELTTFEQPTDQGQDIVSGASAQADIKSQDRELDINPALPPDPKTWDIKIEIIKGKPSKYVMVDGQKIKLTPQEVGLYYESQKISQKSKFSKWLQDDPTGIKKMRREYTERENE